jgi:hypothetical protein
MPIPKEELNFLPTLGDTELIPYSIYQQYYQEDEIYSFPVIMLGGHEVLQGGMLIEIDREKIIPNKYTEEELYGTQISKVEPHYGEIDEICDDLFITKEDYTTQRITNEIPLEFIEKKGYLYYHQFAVKLNKELFGYLCPEVVINLYTLEYSLMESDQ